MLQQAKPDDYVIATGETHSVAEWLEACFGCLGMDYREHIVIDDEFKRPAEVCQLIGDSSKARMALGWRPEVSFSQLVRMMAEADLRLVEQQARA